MLKDQPAKNIRKMYIILAQYYGMIYLLKQGKLRHMEKN